MTDSSTSPSIDLVTRYVCQWFGLTSRHMTPNLVENCTQHRQAGMAHIRIEHAQPVQGLRMLLAQDPCRPGHWVGWQDDRGELVPVTIQGDPKEKGWDLATLKVHAEQDPIVAGGLCQALYKALGQAHRVGNAMGWAHNEFNAITHADWAQRVTPAFQAHVVSLTEPDGGFILRATAATVLETRPDGLWMRRKEQVVKLCSSERASLLTDIATTRCIPPNPLLRVPKEHVAGFVQEIMGFVATDAEALSRSKGFLPSLQHGREALESFWETLDPERRALVDRVRPQTGHFYGWLNGEGQEKHRSWRMQAAAQYPAFIEKISKTKTLSDRVDAGQDLAPALAAEFQTSPTTIRRMRGLTISMLNKISRTPQAMIKVVEALPPNHLPKSGVGPEQYEAFSASLQLVGPLAKEQGQTPEALLSREKPVWLQAKPLDGTPKDIKNIQDMVRDVRRHVLLPLAVLYAKDLGRDPPLSSLWSAIDTGGKDSVLNQAVYGDRSVSRLLELSGVWHKRHKTIQDVVQSSMSGPEASWPALTEAWRSLDGQIQVVPLTNRGELRQEGHVLHHCVGSYAAECLFSNTHVYSMRGPDGTRLSTAEIRLHTGAAGDETRPISGPKGQIEVIQHLGLCNDCVSAAEAKAMQAFVTAVNTGSHPMHLKAVEDGLEIRSKMRSTGRIVEEVGFAPVNAHAREEVFAAHAFLLRGSGSQGSRKEGSLAWAERSGIAQKICDNLAQQFRLESPTSSVQDQWDRVHRIQARDVVVATAYQEGRG